MKRFLIIALLIGAIPAVAFGQNVSCDDCTHEVSVYYGEGGFIATAAEDAEMVTWVASCDGVTRTGELEPNDDGMVSALLMGDLACMSTDKDGNADGSFEVGPVMDGGWYWLTMDDNSAVGGLVSMDVLDNDPADITDAGDSVTMTMGSGAVLLKETATGRGGIRPTILPEPPAKAATRCGYTGSATATSPAVPVKTGCMLGDGKTILLTTSTNAITGATVRIMDKGSITRPSGTGSVTLVGDLWGNGSGHYVTTHDADTANGISAMRGQPALGMVAAARAGTRLQGVTYAVNLSTGGPGAGTSITAGGDGSGTAGGVSWTEAENAVTISVGANAAYCSKDNNHSATVSVTATMATATSADQVVPSIVRSTTSTPEGMVGSTSFTVNCPAASANRGQELVPENPFPTE